MRARAPHIVLATLFLASPVSAQTATPEPSPLWRDQAHEPDRGQPVAVKRFAELARQVSPAVVSIAIWRAAPDDDFHAELRRYFGGNLPEELGPGQGIGSGVIIHPSGYILTNHHVIEDASKIEVRLLRDPRPLTARVVGSDVKTDLALIKIDVTGPLPSAPLGDSEALEIGEWVVAIGNPFGLSHTVTAGIVSGKGRHDVTPSGREGYYDFIQTDASINPGNSGGPLIDLSGAVVGINTAINTAGRGIGFAIPAAMARQIIPGLLRGKVRRSWMGITIRAVTPAAAEALGLDRPRGVQITKVVAGSPAEAAGLKAGDVLLRFNGRAIDDAGRMPWLASSAGVGREVPLRILRDGAQLDLQVRMTELGEDGEPIPAANDNLSDAPGPPAPSASPGARAAALGRLGANLGQADPVGAEVLELQAGGAAAKGKLREGDIILKVNGAAIDTPDDVADALAGVAGDQVVRFYVQRRETQFFLAFRVGEP